MARVIYGLLALALASLVGGFFVRTSTIPLYISIGLSAVVCVLILIGISRRLRTEGFLDQPEAAGELEEIDVGDAEETFVQPRRGGKATRGSVPPAHETVTLERPVRSERESEVEEDAEEEEEDEETFAPSPSRAATGRRPTRPRPRPERPGVAGHKAKPKPKAKSGTSRRVKVIPGRSRYHTTSCRFAQGEDVRDVAESTARKRGYEPCSLCMPG